MQDPTARPEQTRMVNEEGLTLAPVRLQGSSRTRPQRTVAARDVRQRTADAQVEASPLPMHRRVHRRPWLLGHAQGAQVILIPSWVWGRRKHNRKRAFLFVLGPISPLCKDCQDSDNMPCMIQGKPQEAWTAEPYCPNCPAVQTVPCKNHHSTAQMLSIQSTQPPQGTAEQLLGLVFFLPHINFGHTSVFDFLFLLEFSSRFLCSA